MSTATILLTVLSLARMVSNSGVFRFDLQARHGKVLYKLPLSEEARCLRACYEEEECKVAQYEKAHKLCMLYKDGTADPVAGYILSREEIDNSCRTETATDDIPFQRLESRGNRLTSKCNIPAKLNTTVIQTYRSPENYSFFYGPDSEIPNEWEALNPRLLFSKNAEQACTSVPVFHRATHRRLYFGQIYNTSGYYFYNAYAFTDYCVSPNGECVGKFEIREYVDKQGNFLYRMADNKNLEDLKDSGLGQTFYIAGMEKLGPHSL